MKIRFIVLAEQSCFVLKKLMQKIAQSLKEQRTSRLNSQSSMDSSSNEIMFETIPGTDLSVISSSSSMAKDGQNYSPADLHGMWYPTVRRTLVCLSKLFRCLDVYISAKRNIRRISTLFHFNFSATYFKVCLKKR